MPPSSPPADELLARLREAGGGLLIEGEPGIGKTRLWRQVVDAAEASSMRTLVTLPVEAGARLVGGGLIDLLRGVPDAVVRRMPAPQSRAMLAALLREEPGGTPPDPGIVAVALVTLLGLLADESPVLIAVDDLQWLDPTTALALGYAAGRPPPGVSFALALRTTGESVELPAPAADLAARGELERLLVRPLDDHAIAALVVGESGRDLPRTVLARAVEASRGNPFYAGELGRMWATHASEDEAALPIPPSLRTLVASRVDALSEPSRVAVTAASALARPTTATLTGLGVSEADLVEAERAGVLVVDQGQIRFTHPLIAAAAYDALTGSERSRLHRRLTTVVTDVELRARHLALGAEGPDEAVATELDAAAVSARTRGDVHAATEAARLAVRATPADSPHLPDRELRLARMLFVSGDPSAQPILERLARADTPDVVRGRAQVTMCELACSTISHEVAIDYGVAAVETATRLGDEAMQAEACIYLAQAHQFQPVLAQQDAATALHLLEAQADPDPSQLAKALALSAGVDFSLGHGLDHARLQRAKDLEDAAGAPAEDRMTGYYVAMCAYADDLAKARELVGDWIRDNAEHGYERDQSVVLMWRTTIALASGDHAAGAGFAAEHLAYAELSGQTQATRFARYSLGMVAMLRGDFTAAAAYGAELLAEAEAGAGTRIETLGLRLLGEAALAAEDPALAVVHLARVEELRSPELCDPYALAHLPKLIEARLALGVPAGPELDYYERQAIAVDRPGARALAARCRATEALAAADEEGVLAHVDEALRHHIACGHYPIEHARTLLLRGRALRRFRRKAAAREALSAARELCLDAGSLGWVAVIDAELGRMGVRAATDELTATEQRVAEMAAGGRTNKEIAAVLFLSAKTVEVHLTRIYRKLGVRSRTELASRV